MESPEAITPWHIWNGFKIARSPIRLLLDSSEVQRRMNVNKWEASDTAFVHRMFDLLFTLRDDYLQKELTEPERREIIDFIEAYDSLPWKPIPSHPHISELESLDRFGVLKNQAMKVDEILSKRTDMTISAMWHRYRKGWRIFKPNMKHIKAVDTTATSRRVSP